MLLGGFGDRWKPATCSSKQRELSLQVKQRHHTCGPGAAVIKHHLKVLIPLGLEAHLCLDGIRLHSSWLSNTIHSILKSLPLSHHNGQQDEENERKKKAQRKGRSKQARATVGSPVFQQLYQGGPARAQASQELALGPDFFTCFTRVSRWTFLGNWGAYKKAFSKRGCQTIIS